MLPLPARGRAEATHYLTTRTGRRGRSARQHAWTKPAFYPILKTGCRAAIAHGEADDRICLMTTVLLNCDCLSPAELRDPAFADVEILNCPSLPGRKDLGVLKDYARRALPVDPTPSLKEIQARPDVAHLAAPQPAPQKPETPLRVIVAGTDAALSAVLARLMRIDALWTTIGFIPVEGSVAAQGYGIPIARAAAIRLAVFGSPRPTCVIRDDKGSVVAGYATVSDSTGAEMIGEVIVDDEVVHHLEERSKRAPRRGAFGVRLVPMLDAPGIAAVPLVSSLERPRGIMGSLRAAGVVPGETDSSRMRTGRAVQAGGPQLRVSIDGVARSKPVESVTFYRHLRDLQLVRV